MEQIRLNEWLESGWIFEMQGDNGPFQAPHRSESIRDRYFLIGLNEFHAAGPSPVSPNESGSKSFLAQIWLPSFRSLEDSSFESRRAYALTETELLDWLRQSRRTNQPLTADSLELNGPTREAHRTDEPQKVRVAWREPDPVLWKQVFGRLISRLGDNPQEGGGTIGAEQPLRKIVPNMFSDGLARVPVSELQQWISDRLRFALTASRQSPRLRLYGFWNGSAPSSKKEGIEQRSGFIGLSPESLIEAELQPSGHLQVKACAVAATRTRGAAGAMTSQKESEEQSLVTDGIRARFENELGLRSVEVTAPAEEQFGELRHLRSEVSGEAWFSPSEANEFLKWCRHAVAALHPSPAIGAFPADPKKQIEILNELDRDLRAERSGRKQYQGAPMTVLWESTDAKPKLKAGSKLARLRCSSLVMIRGVSWQHNGDDRMELSVGSGCGITSQSKEQLEWQELFAKREAVRRQLGLSLVTGGNSNLTHAVFSGLSQLGIQRFVVCAGARNAPLVRALENSQTQFQVSSHYDERSAAFYALGLARQDPSSKVCVLTTSGTAALECLPALAEADLSGQFLMLLTADRPRRLMRTGSPQTLPQNEIAKNFVSCEVDVETESELSAALDTLGNALIRAPDRPIHFNIRFDEPLMDDGPVQSVCWKEESAQAKSVRPLVVVAGLRPTEVSAVRAALNSLGLPALLEASSGLRGEPLLAGIELKGPESLHSGWLRTNQISHLIRIGGVPTSRLWRDLEDPAVKTQILHLASTRFPGLGFGRFERVDLKDAEAVTRTAQDFLPMEVDRARVNEVVSSSLAVQKSVDELMCRFPEAEPSLLRTLSRALPSDCDLYLGNSLPIRFWDLAADRAQTGGRAHAMANRGVNGIDGQISTSLGLKFSHRTMWAVVGDLTALYDFSGFWELKRHQAPYVLFVVNNQGGQIFNRVVSTRGLSLCLNTHNLSFEPIAQTWGMNYARVQTETELVDALSSPIVRHSLIEIRPKPESTAQLLAEVDRVVNSNQIGRMGPQ